MFGWPGIIIKEEVIKGEAITSDEDMITDDHEDDKGTPSSFLSSTHQSEVRTEAGTTLHDAGPAVTVMDEVVIKEEPIMPDQEMITGDLDHNLGAPSISSTSLTYQPKVKEEADILQETTTVERPCSWIMKQVSSWNKSFSNSFETTTSVPGTPSSGITHKLLQANTKFVEERSVQTYEGTRLEAPVVANWRLFKAEAPEASSERTIVDEESGDDMPFDGISTDDGIDAESDEDGPKHPPYYPTLEPSHIGHACFYCYKMCLRMDQHLPRCHPGEKDVVRLNAMKKHSKARADAVTLITRKGDYYHNLKILMTKANKPLIIVTNNSRRQNNNYGPCPYCLGFFIKDIMCRHIRSCPACSEKITTLQARKLSTAMLLELRNPSKNEAFIDCLRQLREDHISAVILKDDLIMKCGLQLFESKGPSHSVYVRQKMRQLGRLLCALREISTSTPDAEASLLDFVNPEKLDLVVTAVHNLCGAFSFDGRIEQTRPGLALHLRHSLRKCARLAWGMGIRLDDKTMVKRAERFLNILEGEWDDKIYSTELGTLKQQKLNATELHPLTHDLICFNRHLKETMDSLQHQLQIAFSFNVWSEFANYTLARLVLFNLRCATVVSRMLTTDYNERTSWADRNISQEIAATLTKTEQRVASQRQLVEVVGRKGRVEPIILTAEVAAAMELIMQLRTLHNIQTENKYFFVCARGSGYTYVKNYDAITKCVTKANLVNPELLTGSNLKKYTAVVCQLLDLQPPEQLWLIKHLGHSEAVYEQDDEVHRNATEMAKVCALLVAVDEGHMEKFADKSLAEIILKEIPLRPQVGPTVSLPLDAPSVITRPDAPSHASSLASSEPQTSTSKFTCGDSDSDEDSEEIYRTSNDKKQKCQRWSFLDKGKILDAFRPHTKQGTLPEKSAVIAFLEQNPHMKKKRKWKDVQNLVRHVSYNRKKAAVKKKLKKEGRRTCEMLGF